MPHAATMPLVISASRATDIPAFHSGWLMERLRAGSCVRINPFNRRPSVISFAQCRVLVLWSKNPAPLLPHLDEIEQLGFQYYFHYTLNDYTAEGLEPNLPPLSRRMDSFCTLAERIGPHRVIWRFDPFILGEGLATNALLERIDRIGTRLSPYTEKLVFSFLDSYRASDARLRPLGLRSPTLDERRHLVQGLATLNQLWPHPLTLASCAEEADYSAFGVIHNHCIDEALIRRLCPDDVAIQTAYGGKDRGQRPACGCAPSRDIGAYDSCPHLCAYCYANHSEQKVFETIRQRQKNSPSLA